MGEVSVTLVDVLVVLVLLVSGGYAMWRGLVSETFTIIDWVVAAFVAVRFTPSFQPLLRGTIEPEWLEYAVVFVGTFLLMFIPLSILNHRLSEAVQKSEIGPVDRVLGGIFGVGRGLAIIGLVYIAFSQMVAPENRPEILTRSRLYPLILRSSEVILTLVPGQPGLARLEQRNDSARRTPAPRSAADTPPEPRPAATPSRSGTDAADAKTYGANDRSALDKLIEGSTR